jgi:hypothetical protein
MSGFEELFRRAEGLRIPGGCDTCDAFQTVSTLTPGVHELIVHHDDSCPTLRAIKAGEN